MESQPKKAETRSTAPSVLGKIIAVLSIIVKPLIGVFGATVASTVLAGMMFLTFVDVFGRYLLNKPIDGSLEVTEYLMGLLVGFGIGYCALRKGHIRVDLVMQYTSRKANQWFDVFTYGVSCIFFVFVTWQTWIYGFNKLASKMTSAVLLIPVYPFVFAICVGAAFLVLVLLRDFLQSIEEVRK